MISDTFWSGADTIENLILIKLKVLIVLFFRTWTKNTMDQKQKKISDLALGNSQHTAISNNINII